MGVRYLQVDRGASMCPITAPPSIGHKNEFNQQNETYFQNLWSIEGPEPLTDSLTLKPKI